MPATNKNIKPIRSMVNSLIAEAQAVRTFIVNSIQATETNANFERDLFNNNSKLDNITRQVQTIKTEINRVLQVNTPYRANDVVYCIIDDVSDTVQQRCAFNKYSQDNSYCMVAILRTDNTQGEKYIVPVAELSTTLREV